MSGGGGQGILALGKGAEEHSLRALCAVSGHGKLIPEARIVGLKEVCGALGSKETGEEGAGITRVRRHEEGRRRERQSGWRGRYRRRGEDEM